MDRKKGGQIGNKNAVGNRGGGAPFGNKNAVGHAPSVPAKNANAKKHGLYSKFFTAEVREIYEELRDANPLDLLWNNIIFLQAEILRSQQIMFVKDSSDKTIEKVGFSDGSKMQSEQWEVQQAWDKQGNYLKALSRAQAELLPVGFPVCFAVSPCCRRSFVFVVYGLQQAVLKLAPKPYIDIIPLEYGGVY